MIHGPRTSLLDTATGRYRTPRGRVAAIDRFEPRGSVLYFAAPEVDNPRLRSLECWVLPHRSLRVLRWELLDPATATEADFDYYIDFCRIDTFPGRVEMTDDYLDVKVWHGKRLSVADVDELLAAVAAGFIGSDEAQRVIESAFEVAVAVTAAGFLVPEWLAQEGGK